MPAIHLISSTGENTTLQANDGDSVMLTATNAGLDGSVICENVKKGPAGYGFDALNETYVDMVEAGIVDPAKVTRSALQNAASVSATLLTTEAVVCDIPQPEPPMQNPGAGMY